ncbi:M20/M25/M40 family metallo-hydrolase [Termitidicoccus mucosus]|uniref:M20 family metallopeptidase n=1 Tax=Termitidicoccus mucosus TaxID=1184151 RepID=UPI002FEE586D
MKRPSVSPEGEAGGSEPGERAMADYLAGLLRGLGGEVSVVEVQPGRPNVVGRFPAGTMPDDNAAPVIALVPHLDTVGVGGMTIPPFAPAVRGGKIFGRGATDTKGPMAAALWALARWLRSPAAGHSRVTWVFAATMGEEEMSTGAAALCKAGFRANFAVVLEPTDLRIVRAEKGVLRVWVEAAGRACHGATPERGDNAVYKLLPFLRACQEELAPALAAARHPDLGGASLNVGVVRGGNELNIVPDACRAGLDIRTHPGMPNAEILARVRAAVAASEMGGGKGPGSSLSVRVHRDGPPFVLAENHPWVRRLAVHAKGVEVAPWFSDANVLNANGTPAVAFGPGAIAQAHTKDEFIESAALEEGARVLEEFIDSISRQ